MDTIPTVTMNDLAHSSVVRLLNEFELCRVLYGGTEYMFWVEDVTEYSFCVLLVVVLPNPTIEQVHTFVKRLKVYNTIFIISCEKRTSFVHIQYAIVPRFLVHDVHRVP